MVRISFLPFICDEYPDAYGWVDWEFDSEKSMLDWLVENRDSIELVRFDGESVFVELADWLLHTD